MGNSQMVTNMHCLMQALRNWKMKRYTHKISNEGLHRHTYTMKFTVSDTI